LIRDVANVELGNSIRYGAMTLDGKGEVVGGIVMMMKGENGSEVIKRVKDKMAEIQSKLPNGLTIEPFIDREKLVNRSISTVSTNLIEGAVIVMLVILVFLGNWRASLLAASVIPLAMLFAFGLMEKFKVTGSLMSLGAIDFGLLVDPAIIVVESVVFFLAMEMSRKAPGTKLKYAERQNLVIAATAEVKRSVVFGGLIILIVYFPILTLQGIEGKMFIPMAKTVSFAILGALLLSITYVPMMSALFLRPPANVHDHGFSEKIVSFLYKGIDPLIRFGLMKKYLVIIFAMLVLMAGGFGFMMIGGEFIPKLQEGDIVIETKLPVGSNLTESILLSKKIQQRLLKKFPDEITSVVSKVGTSEVPLDPVPLETQDVMISLKPHSHWKKTKSQEVLTEMMAQELKTFPGLVFSMMQPIENRVNELMSGAKTDVVIKLYGFDLDSMVSKGNEIIKIIQEVEGAEDVQETKVFGLPQINIKYNREHMAFYGITSMQINRALQTAFAGSKAGTVYENDKRFDLTLRLESSARMKMENLYNLPVSDKDGDPIPLKVLADISENIGPSEISHENLKRKMNIGFNVRGRDLASVVNDVRVKIDQKIFIPKGFSLSYGGEFENFERAKDRLAVVLPVALVIIFILLFITFGNFRDSFLIYSVVPLSAVGGVFSLLLRDMNFSISAGVGFIALFGVAVLNGILLVGKFNSLGAEGILDPEERVLIGLKERFRPVLMTSFVAALGFLPMALSTSAGAEVQKPLATVVIGGLFTATILTLIVLPVVYTIFKKDNKESWYVKYIPDNN
jgi:cobalt-zinc-cadmium resistance protein CzcA